MSLFKSKKQEVRQPVAMPAGAIENYSALAELTLNAITDGVMLVDEIGMIKFANPAAATMIGQNSPANIIGLNYESVLRFENIEGAPVAPDQNKLFQAMATNQSLSSRDYLLVSAQGDNRSAAVALTLIPTGGPHDNRIITFRDITKELEEEEKQSEFISTASHEMRTPVASIEGYLGLALNPQTATIDARAKQYLEAAHSASQHLGRLFKDLLDVTKLDDGRQKLHEVPVDIVAVVKSMAGAREKDMQAKHLKYSFGTADAVVESKQIEPLVYAAVDLDFLREIIDNLIDNAIKYTPEGGEIWVNARGDGDKALINVTDTGIGVSPEDASHIFQKFYRVDNSQTRQIGGTGLGLYLVKQRVEAMGGRVWVESSFGDGSTFFVSLPRLSSAEYEQRLVVYQNEQAVQAFKMSTQTGAAKAPAPGQILTTPQAAPQAVVSTLVATPTPAMAPIGAQVNSAAISTPVAPQSTPLQPTSVQPLASPMTIAQPNAAVTSQAVAPTPVTQAAPSPNPVPTAPPETAIPQPLQINH